MYTLLKKILPTSFKEKLKRLHDRMIWMASYRKYPFIINNRFGIKLIAYPWDDTLIQTALSAKNREQEYSALDKLLKKDDTVFDVGSNIGTISIYASRIIGSNGVVYSFEPVHDTFNILQTTVHLNECENIHMYKLGISDNQGRSKIFKYGESHTLSSLGDVEVGNGKPTNNEEITLDTLDNFVTSNNITHIDMLKVDVEGYEEEVFAGAQKTLSEKRITHIQFEISKAHLDSLEKNIDGIVSKLTPYGYSIYRYDFQTQAFEGPIKSIESFFENYYASLENLTELDN